MSKAVIEENSPSLLPMLWILEVLMRNVLIVTSIIAATAGAAVAQQHTTHAITPEFDPVGPCSSGST